MRGDPPMSDLPLLDARRPTARRTMLRIVALVLAALATAGTAWFLRVSVAANPERLLVAVRSGDLDGVREILGAGVPADARAERAWPVVGLDDTALLAAAATDRADVVRALLDAGADPNFRDEMGSTPLTRAAGGGSFEVVDLLLARGARPGAGDVGTGWTALHSAALADRPDVVRCFLEHGADPLHAARDGRLPVHVALERGAAQAAIALARPPAERDVFEAAALGPRARLAALLGAQPAWVAASPPPLSGTPLLHLAAYCGNADSVDVLVDAGADPGARGPGKGAWSQTPLHLAAQRGHEAAVRRLLDRGARVDANLGRGTPLHFACAAGHADVVRLLLDRGANVNARQQGPDSGTPLHFAASNGRAAVVEVLIGQGADGTATSGGATALARALRNGDARTIELLRGR